MKETNISGKPSIYFNNATVEQTPVQKHLSINCDSKLLGKKIRHAKKINMFSCQTDCFKIVVFPSFIAEWDKLGPGIQNSSSESTFNKALLKFISPVASTT